MADIEEVNKISGAFGGVEIEHLTEEQQMPENAGTIRQVGGNLPAKVGFWNKLKSFWLQNIEWNKEIKVELSQQQKNLEQEINDFLYQDITWRKVHDFLFQKLTF